MAEDLGRGGRKAEKKKERGCLPNLASAPPPKKSLELSDVLLSVSLQYDFAGKSKRPSLRGGVGGRHFQVSFSSVCLFPPYPLNGPPPSNPIKFADISQEHLEEVLKHCEVSPLCFGPRVLRIGDATLVRERCIDCLCVCVGERAARVPRLFTQESPSHSAAFRGG